MLTAFGVKSAMKSTYRYGVFLVLSFLLVAICGQSFAGEDGAKKTETKGADHIDANKETSDPLGRSTPHGTVFGFLQAAQSGKYKEASQYLQLSRNERTHKGERLAEQLHALMDSAFVGRVGTISDRREGSVQAEVPRDHERIGVFRINGSETAVDLVRVTDPAAGEIWLFPSTVLAAVPELFDQIENNEVESTLPAFLQREPVFNTPLWRVLAFLLLIPISYALAWGMVKLVREIQRMWRRWRRHSILEDAHHSLSAPIALILTVVFHQIGVYLLGIPLLIRVYYQRFIGTILVAALAWLVFLLVNRWGERARVKALAGSGYQSGSLVLLGQRILNAFVVVIAVLTILSILGFNISAVVAGLGIGSIAIAFAAQKTLENLLGGISILGDQVIRVGEVCQIGDQEGTIEDISLRSTRIRTLERTELSVPNGQLANMNVENLSRRDKILFQTKIKLRQETSPHQLRSVLSEIRTLLHRHTKVDPNAARVRFAGFGDSSLDIDLFCYILTSEFNEFLAIREDLLLQIMGLVADAGTGLAIPARAISVAPEQQSQTAADNAAILRHGSEGIQRAH